MRRLVPVLFLLVLLLPRSGAAQAVSLTDARFLLGSGGQEVHLQRVYLADLVLGAAARPLFQLVLSGGGPSAPRVQLRLQVDAEAGGRRYDRVVTALTDPIPLSRPVVRITNQEFGETGRPLPDGTRLGGSSDTEFDDLQNRTLGTGTLPAGTYKFTVALLANRVTVQSETLTLIIDQPSSVLTLVSPGEPATLALSPTAIVPTTLPTFVWEGDPAGRGYRVRVFEVIDGQRSPQQVAQNVPNLDIADIRGFTFQYPASGPNVRPLIPGRSYLWTVEATLAASGPIGQETIRAPIYGFTVATNATAIQSDLNPDDSPTTIIGGLETLLGEDFAGQIDPLLPLTPVGGQIDGTETTPAALRELYRRAAAGEIQILSIHEVAP